MNRIYLDNNSTTALDPRVLKAMLGDLHGMPANPSSLHWFGRQAREKLNAARQTVASFFQVDPKEVIFTSGGTESANLFLRGLQKGHVITSTIEHSCIYKTLQQLETSGQRVTYLPVGAWGAPLPSDVETAICEDTKAIVLSAANSETGVLIDIEAMAKIALKHRIPLFIDAVAFIGKESFIMYPGITAVSLSGHKFHGPKGIGALILKSFQKLSPQCTGGAQEFLHRAGTENLAGILGLAEAIHILKTDQRAISEHLTDLKKHFEQGLKQKIADLQIHGEGPRVSNTTSLAFPKIDGENLLIQLDMEGIAVSHGSACASGAIEPSRVLTQMGISQKIARSSLRFSFSRFNTREEIDIAIEKIFAIVNKLSSL